MTLPDALCADLILVNGRVLTMDRAGTVAEALAVRSFGSASEAGSRFAERLLTVARAAGLAVALAGAAQAARFRRKRSHHGVSTSSWGLPGHVCGASLSPPQRGCTFGFWISS